MFCKIASAAALAGCVAGAVAAPHTPVISPNFGMAQYDVVKRDGALSLDGKVDEAVWADVPAISGAFHFPWMTQEAPRTVFKGFSDGQDFYFSFVVRDKQELAAEQWQDESTVDGEDRVELFFAGAPVDRPGEDGMERYYAIEVDPKGRVHDYSIAYYRQFDGDWSLAGLETKAALTDDGYSVEGKIPLKTLQELHLLRDGLMRTGVFRAEFSPSSGTEPRMEWISWVNPNTPQPDFHVDSAFGVFRFLP